MTDSEISAVLDYLGSKGFKIDGHMWSGKMQLSKTCWIETWFSGVSDSQLRIKLRSTKVSPTNCPRPISINSTLKFKEKIDKALFKITAIVATGNY